MKMGRGRGWVRRGDDKEGGRINLGVGRGLLETREGGPTGLRAYGG